MEQAFFDSAPHSREPSAAPEQEPSGAADPRAIADSLARALRDPDRAGAVLTGPPGSGRHAAVDEALSDLEDPVRIIRISGSEFGANLPLGALSYLLSELDAVAGSSRHELIHALGRRLCPEGRRAVAVLGKPHLLDIHSAAILAQLTAMGKIRLLVVCEQPQDLPREILEFLRRGQLELLTLKPLGVKRLHEFLQQELGEPMSMYALAMLRYFTQNNRELMLELARIWISQGQLVLREGTWLLADLSLASGPGLEMMFNSMTGSLDDAERELLYAVALCGPVQLARVQHAQLAEAVDALCSRGQLRIGHADGQQLVFAVPLIGLLVRQHVHPEAAAGHEPLLALMQRLYPDPALARLLASLQHLHAVGDHARLIERAEAFARFGYDGPAGWTSPMLRARILKFHVHTLLVLDRWAGALELIRRAEVELNRHIVEHGFDHELLQASQEIGLLEMLAALGSHGTPGGARAGGCAPARIELTGWLSESLRLRAAALQCEIWATGTRQCEAMALARSIDRELRSLQGADTMVGAGLAEDAPFIQEVLLHCELLSGQWNKAALRLRSMEQRPGTAPRLMAEAATLFGMLRGLNDDADGALRLLQPCLAQLRQFDLAGARAAAQAVVGYALAVQGHGSPVPGWLDAAAEPGRSGFHEWVRQSFIALALAHGGLAAEARQRLLRQAQWLQPAGLGLLRLFTLGLAMRMGSSAASTQVCQLAAGSHGPLERAYADIARGLMGSAELSALQLQVLVRAGHQLMTSSQQNAVFSALSLKEQRQLAKFAFTLLQPLALGQRSKRQVQEAIAIDAPAWHQQLTKRESEIVSMVVQGKSNAEIARLTGISIRTVEGHLYQSYAKLQVGNRQELVTMNHAGHDLVGHQ